MGTYVTTLIFAILLFSNAQAAEFTHGDQVIFTGGASQPPESRDTGLKLEVGLRGGTPVRGAGDVKEAPVPDEKTQPLRYSDLSAKNQDDLQALTYDASPDMRASAFKTLAAIAPKKLTPASRKSLRESIYDEDSRVIELGANLLGHIKDRPSVPPLIKLVDIGKPPIERAAVKALGNIGDSRALPSLKRISGLELKKLSPLARKAIKKIRARLTIDGKFRAPQDLSAPKPSSSATSRN